MLSSIEPAWINLCAMLACLISMYTIQQYIWFKTVLVKGELVKKACGYAFPVLMLFLFVLNLAIFTDRVLTHATALHFQQTIEQTR